MKKALLWLFELMLVLTSIFGLASCGKDVEFDFNYEMSGFNMQMEVSPVDYNGYYYYGYFNMDEFYSYYGADADLAEQV